MEYVVEFLNEYKGVFMKEFLFDFRAIEYVDMFEVSIWRLRVRHKEEGVIYETKGI